MTARLPLAPLLEHAGNVLALSRMLCCHPRQVHRWQQSGVPVFQADRAAVGLGFHPAELWPQWWDLDLPPCGICGLPFAADSASELYCSDGCKAAALAVSRKVRRERAKARAA